MVLGESLLVCQGNKRKKKRVAHEDACVRLCLSEGWYDAISLPLEKKASKIPGTIHPTKISKKKKKKNRHCSSVVLFTAALFIRHCSHGTVHRHCSSDENFYYYRCDQNTSLLYPNLLDVSVYITILIRVFFIL